MGPNTVEREQFDDFYDASAWMEHYLEEIPDGEFLFEARIVFLNGKWTVGISYGPSQMNFDFDGAPV